MLINMSPLNRNLFYKVSIFAILGYAILQFSISHSLLVTLSFIEIDEQFDIPEIRINEDINANISESVVFQNTIDRATSSLKTCHSILNEKGTPLSSDRKKFSNVSLPEFGVIAALSGWLSKSESFKGEQKKHSKSVSWNHNLSCSLPPTKSCKVEGFTVILMSHTLDRLKTLQEGIRKVASWKNTHEIILVWNSDPEILKQNHDMASLLRKYHSDPNHPLRIFYALENGLENNLFNRYHPGINPKMEALLYFDDDGPFFEEDAMNSGFELWKRDSGRQVGCFPRNVRFKSSRMIEQGKVELQKSISEIEQSSNEENLSLRPNFVPTCQTAAGDKLEYNFFTFAQYQAHMLLPSGSFLHKNLLCWLWHPAFEEIRQFVLEHPTHPDDMTVSTIVSHLTGKAPRVFPRRIKRSRRRNLSGSKRKSDKTNTWQSLSINENIHDMKSIDSNITDIFIQGIYSSIVEDIDERNRLSINLNHQYNATKKEGSTTPKPPHDIYLKNESTSMGRKLLWQQENWAEMREEAIGFMIGYFGSINPGSVGWCTGTEYHQYRERKNEHYCDPEFPQADQLPWMSINGLGHDGC